VRNAETALKEKEDSLFAHQDAARTQQEETQRSIVGKYSRFRCRLILIYRSLSWFL
jgi:hypothetical protein